VRNAICIIFVLLTGMIGYQINNHSLVWAVIDGLFWIFTWIKWIICHDVTWSIIKHTFDWFFQ